MILNLCRLATFCNLQCMCRGLPSFESVWIFLGWLVPLVLNGCPMPYLNVEQLSFEFAGCFYPFMLNGCPMQHNYFEWLWVVVVWLHTIIFSGCLMQDLHSERLWVCRLVGPFHLKWMSRVKAILWMFLSLCRLPPYFHFELMSDAIPSFEMAWSLQVACTISLSRNATTHPWATIVGPGQKK